MNNNKFLSQQWQILYAKHKKTVDNIQHRDYKFPNEVELQLQRQRDANRKVKNSQYFKQNKYSLVSSNLISSSLENCMIQSIENKKNSSPIRWSTKSLREETYNKIKDENQKQFKRITHVKGTLQTQ